MVMALRHPELIDRLCVVDVSPVAYDGLSNFADYVRAMRALDLHALTSRAAADAALAPLRARPEHPRLLAAEPAPRESCR